MTDSHNASLDLSGTTAPVTDLEAFVAADGRRGTGFISNFGTWHLPPPVASAMSSQVAHLEWAHDTGELFLLGAVPVLGVGSVDVPEALAAADRLGSVGGGESVATSGREVSPGLVREFFPAETVPAGTTVAVLATIEHGWTVHEALWGWHLHQHDTDGWDWLIERLETHAQS